MVMQPFSPVVFTVQSESQPWPRPPEINQPLASPASKSPLVTSCVPASAVPENPHTERMNATKEKRRRSPLASHEFRMVESPAAARLATGTRLYASTHHGERTARAGVEDFRLNAQPPAAISTPRWSSAARARRSSAWAGAVRARPPARAHTLRRCEDAVATPGRRQRPQSRDHRQCARRPLSMRGVDPSKTSGMSIAKVAAQAMAACDFSGPRYR
jgi:hypothetical protein